MSAAKARPKVSKTLPGKVARTASQEVADVVGRLPRRQRTVVALHYLEKFSPDEIAEILGTTRAEARKLHTQAMRKIRERLEKLGSRGGKPRKRKA